ncbi:hypothetical protein FOZ63_023479, partial [Perkinsus olseni]
MLKALMVLVQQSKLPPDVFYVALVLHRDAVLQLRECRSGCSLPHLFARYGGWRQIYIFTIFGGDVDAPLRECGGQSRPIADLDHHTPSVATIVSVPTSLTPVPLSLLGPTPLLHALRYLNLREAEALVEAGADVTIADEEGRVPLSVAMRYSISSPRLLIALADPRVLLVKDRSGQSPLHHAAFYDRHQQVETLLSSPHFTTGFPLEALRCVNSEGFTPWEVARQEGHSRCADILRPPEGDTKRSEGSPRLRFAAQMQCPLLKMVQLCEEEREAAEHRATNLEGTLVQERDKSAAAIEQLRQLLFQKDDASGTPPRDRLLSPSTQHSEDKSSGDQVLLERNSVSLQHYEAEKLEHSRRSEAALLSKDETIAKLREEKEAVAAEKSRWEEEKRQMLEQNARRPWISSAAMQTRFDSLLTESARLQAEVYRLQSLNDAAATEFEVLRSAETSARKQVGALQSSVLNHQREVADLLAELARMRRRTAEAGVQTEASHPRREELLEENSALKKEVGRLAEELE